MDVKELLKQTNNWVKRVETGGVDGLRLVRDALVHMRDHGASGPLMVLLTKTPPAYQRLLRLIAGRVLIGYTMGKEKLEKAKGKNQGFNEDTLKALDDMVTRKVSLLSSEVRETFKATKSTVQQTQVEMLLAQKKRLTKWCEDNDMSVEDLINALRGQVVIEPNF